MLKARCNWSVPKTRRLPYTETVYCSEVGRTAWIVLQLLPEIHNVIDDATAGGFPVFIAANFVQQL
jgi:hypothetical protein